MTDKQKNRDENPKPGAVRPQKINAQTDSAIAAVSKFGAFIAANYGVENTPLTLEYIQAMLDPYVEQGQDLRIMEGCLTEINRMVGGFDLILSFFDLVDTAKPDKQVVMDVIIGEVKFHDLPKEQQKLFYTLALMVARIKLEYTHDQDKVAELAEYCLHLDDLIHE